MGDPLTSLMVQAAKSGVQTSLAELMTMFGVSMESPLSGVQSLVDQCHEYGLEFVPPPDQGELGTQRTLRAPLNTAARLAKILALLATGETNHVEFKESLLCSMKDFAKGQEVEFPGLAGEALKSVCAFLNTGGGDLLIGVNDKGQGCGGLDADLQVRKWTTDQWQLHWENLLKDRFHDSVGVRRMLDCEMVETDAGRIFHVVVAASSEPVFVKRTAGGPYEFFVRTGPRTLSLNLPDFYAFMVAAQP